MTKKIKTQNSGRPTDNSYQGQIRNIHYFDLHIANITATRNVLIEQIKKEFGKSDENIEYELGKLKTKVV